MTRFALWFFTVSRDDKVRGFTVEQAFEKGRKVTIENHKIEIGDYASGQPSRVEIHHFHHVVHEYREPPQVGP
jgi:hypothetical protein